MGICKWCAWECRIPRCVCVCARAHMVASPRGGGVACIASPLGACPECFAHASAEYQSPSEAITAAAPGQTPLPRRS
jgi:hypothetical protein